MYVFKNNKNRWKDEKILTITKIFAILLLVVGCGTTQGQSVTQQLVGEYVNYINDGKEERCKIILEKQKNEEDTFGNATIKFGTIQNGTYKIYEESKIIEIEYEDEEDKSSHTMEVTFDLEKKTLTLTGYNCLIFEKK